MKLHFFILNFWPFVNHVIPMCENIPGSPNFSVLQVTKGWAGPGNEASWSTC